MRFYRFSLLLMFFGALTLHANEKFMLLESFSEDGIKQTYLLELIDDQSPKTDYIDVIKTKKITLLSEASYDLDEDYLFLKGFIPVDEFQVCPACNFPNPDNSDRCLRPSCPTNGGNF